MAIWPVCPSCGASAKDDNKFRVKENYDDLTDHTGEFLKIPEQGEELRSAALLTCVRCSFEFPLWTYTVGRSDSFVSNARDDDGDPWDPEHGETWWAPTGPTIEQVVEFEEAFGSAKKIA